MGTCCPASVRGAACSRGLTATCSEPFGAKQQFLGCPRGTGAAAGRDIWQQKHQAGSGGGFLAGYFAGRASTPGRNQNPTQPPLIPGLPQRPVQEASASPLHPAPARPSAAPHPSLALISLSLRPGGCLAPQVPTLGAVPGSSAGAGCPSPPPRPAAPVRRKHRAGLTILCLFDMKGCSFLSRLGPRR